MKSLLACYPLVLFIQQTEIGGYPPEQPLLCLHLLLLGLVQLLVQPRCLCHRLDVLFVHLHSVTVEKYGLEKQLKWPVFDDSQLLVFLSVCPITSICWASSAILARFLCSWICSSCSCLFSSLRMLKMMLLLKVVQHFLSTCFHSQG